MVKKVKIGIHLPNRDIQDVTLSDPETGNPGIGGTQFLLFSLPYYLDKYYKNEFEFIILADYDKPMITNFVKFSVTNLEDAAKKAKELLCELFIFRPTSGKETVDLLKKIKELKLNSIAWSFNTPRFLLNSFYRNEYIVRFICVGRDQYETLRDHLVINKSSLIYNAVDPAIIPFSLENQKTKSVVFLGSLSFAKGFHLVAKMWKKILKYHPDAELHVIGSGKLYDRNQKFGPLGLADEKYEKWFSKYLLTDAGMIHDSVKFHGVMGTDKYKIMGGASVGIGTHPDLRETFCLAAVEFELCGTPVVSSAYGGLLDTVDDGVSGFLRNSSRNRLKSILALLSDPDLSSRMGLAGRKFASEKFNYEKICKEWYELINDVLSSSDIKLLPITQSKRIKLDKFREFLRIIKLKYYIFRILPSSIYFIHSLEFIKLRIQRIRF
jgi:glycosyltransferase involved in cell wall biosynthesis